MQIEFGSNQKISNSNDDVAFHFPLSRYYQTGKMLHWPHLCFPKSIFLFNLISIDDKHIYKGDARARRAANGYDKHVPNLMENFCDEKYDRKLKYMSNMCSSRDYNNVVDTMCIPLGF